LRINNGVYRLPYGSLHSASPDYGLIVVEIRFPLFAFKKVLKLFVRAFFFVFYYAFSIT
jgi:hypothetical protein